MWKTHNKPYQPYSFTVVAFPCMVGRVELLMDWQHSCTPFVRSERRLMGQRAWVRRGKRGRDARWIAQPSPEQDGEHHSSSLLIAAFPRPSAILERGKSGCLLSPSLTTWHSFGKASAAEDTFCSSLLGDNMFAEKKFWRETFFHLDFFLWFFVSLAFSC